MNANVLVVDDEAIFRLMAEEALTSEGFHVTTAPTLGRARREMEAVGFDVILLDRRLPDGDGLDFLKELRAEGAGPLVIMVTAYGDVENAVEALQAGAWDYLAKPVQLTDLVVKLRKVLEARGLHDRLALARQNPSRPAAVAPRSAAMVRALQTLETVAVSPLTPVFLVGPSGAGKQYAAEMLHTATVAKGPDRDAPFVEINCAALPAELIESELFGHEKGAFTDARSTRRGLIEMANGGTLFLDEVTRLPLHSQAKLLKFLDSLSFRRVGGSREITVELRVVAATNEDPEELVREGAFREDLYHRLAVFSVRLPPLAERREDIAPLAEGFVRHFAGRLGKPVSGISPEGLEALEAYAFPGNVRELRNIVERAVILATGSRIDPTDLTLPGGGKARAKAPAFFSVAPEPDGDPPPLQVVEREYVAAVLAHFDGRRMAAAKALGISYPTFLKKLRELEFPTDF